MNKKSLSEADICSKYITPAVTAAGWDEMTQVRREVSFTKGRIIVRGKLVTRGKSERADYILYYKPNIPIALIEAKDNNHAVGAGMQQALKYAATLDIPFVFTSNGDAFVFHDRTGQSGQMETELPLDAFPSPAQLWASYRAWKGLTSEQEQVVLQDYYEDGSGKEPRYYQQIAINRTTEAIARGENRALLVMATGTGKTYTAFQILWRLWKAGRKKRILFLADRNILANQTMLNDFRPFGSVMAKLSTASKTIEREDGTEVELTTAIHKKHRRIDTSYEVYIALYQAITGPEDRQKLYRELSPNFFDLIVVDECHRGSAAEDSAWREILDYFSSATQIGLTATPRETEYVSNIHYFGKPVYTYSLKQGIRDGFLAPYKVVKVHLDVDVEGYRPVPGEVDKYGPGRPPCHPSGETWRPPGLSKCPAFKRSRHSPTKLSSQRPIGHIDCDLLSRGRTVDQKKYDVAVLGSGIAGATLAAILGRQGFRVLLLEKGTHPRFAVGEAMQPQSSMLMWILGERFDVPEIGHISSTEKILKHVTRNCGVKKTFGFLYHEEGKLQDPKQAHLLIPPPTPLVSESHLFRQDIDHYLVKAAIKYGADYRDRIDVEDFAINDDGVVLRTSTGEEFSARYLVDGSGHKSIVANKFGLRPADPDLRTQSRTIFTHMKGFRRYDDTIPPEELPGLSRGWYEGTLHHMIDGGWFWVIRFDNVPGSESDITSIGVTVDMRKYPKRDIPPEQEFYEIVSKYPSIVEHLKGGVAVRPWVGTDRLQFSATDSVGPRCFLMSHAHGFIDALYSRGMINTFEQIHALAPRLIQALRDDDFSPERFDYPRRLQASMIKDNDRMVFNSFRSFADFDTWNAWLRLWLVNIIFGDLRMFRVCLKYLASRNEADLAALDDDPLPLSTAPGENLMEDLYRFGDETLDRWEAGEISAQEAAAAIFQKLGEANLPPIHAWGDPKACHLDFLPEKLHQMVGWGMTEAPPNLRRMFDFDPSVLAMLPPQPVLEEELEPAVAVA